MLTSMYMKALISSQTHTPKLARPCNILYVPVNNKSLHITADERILLERYNIEAHWFVKCEQRSNTDVHELC